MSEAYVGIPGQPVEYCPVRKHPHDHILCGSVPMCVATYYEGHDEPNLECTRAPSHAEEFHYDGHRGIHWKIGRANA